MELPSVHSLEGGARTADPDTSHQAAGKVYLSVDHIRAILGALANGSLIDERLYMIASAGDPMTESGYRGRRKALQRLGYLEDTGRRSLTHTGREAIVWAITAKGREVLQSLMEGARHV